MPIRLTPAAIAHVIQWIHKKSGIGIFVGVKKHGCSGLSYVIDVVQAEALPDDAETFVVDTNLPQTAPFTLFVDKNSLSYLTDICIDYTKPEETRDLLQGPRLVFINPNKKGTCGCGESFYV